MKKQFPAAFIALPAIYLVLTIIFIFLHFSNLERFSGVLDNISVTGKQSLQTRIQSPEVREINISFNGILFRIKKFSPIVLTTSDEIRHNLSLEGYEIKNGILKLYLKYGIILNFIPDRQSREVILKPVIPELIPPVKSLQVPVTLLSDFQLNEDYSDNFTTAATDGEETYFIKIPNDASLDLSNGTYIFNHKSDIEQVLVSSPESGMGKSVDLWYQNEGKTFSGESFQENVSSYISKTFSGWQQRYDERTGKWELPNGGSKFSTRAINSFLAESVKRNQLEKGVLFILNSIDSDSPRLTIKNAAFLGNTYNQTIRGIRKETIRYRDILEDLETSSSDVLYEEDIFSLFYNFGKGKELNRLATYILDIKPDEPFLDSLRRIELISQAEKTGIEINGGYEAVEELWHNRLFPHIYWVNEGLFIIDDSGVTDLEQTIKTGAALIHVAEAFNDEKHMAIGMKMVDSVLQYSDSKGYIPQKLIFNGNEIVERQGYILPEDIYDDIQHNEYLPEMYPMVSELGAGSWLLNSAGKVRVNHTPAETTINIDFPVGMAHYMAIKGIRPFDRVFLHGIKWNTDRRYERYSDGWFYDRDSQTLFVKITHRNETEVLRILYYGE